MLVLYGISKRYYDPQILKEQSPKVFMLVFVSVSKAEEDDRNVRDVETISTFHSNKWEPNHTNINIKKQIIKL